MKHLAFRINNTDLIYTVYDLWNLHPMHFQSDDINSDMLPEILRRKFMVPDIDVKREIVKCIQEKIITKQIVYRKYNNDDEQNIRKIVLWFDVPLLAKKYNCNLTPIHTTRSNESAMMSQSLYEQLQNTIGPSEKVYALLKYIYTGDYSQTTDRHFTINQKGEMTYTPAGRSTVMSMDDTTKWSASKKYRSIIKYHKGIRKIFGNGYMDVSDKLIEELGNALKSKYTFNGKIKVVKGAEIQKWYLESNYASDTNTESLGNSCMRHRGCQDFFRLYTDNPKNVRMAIATNHNDKLIGRAIVWITDEGVQFMDRIYGNSLTIEAFKDYAQQKGWYYKQNQNYSDPTLVKPNGQLTDMDLCVTLDVSQCTKFPYMDTMKFCIEDPCESETIVLRNHNEDSNYTFDSTEGGNFGNYVTLHCGDRVHEEDARYVERYGDYYYRDDVVYSEYYGEDIVYDEARRLYCDDYVWADDCDFVEANDTGCYHHIDDVVYSDYEEVYLYESCTCEVHGDISVSNAKIMTVADVEYNVHDDVSVRDMYEHNLITEADYEEWCEENV